MGFGGIFPLWATGLVRPVISLPSLQPRSAVANAPPPFPTGPSQLHLGAVSDPSFFDEVEEEMDASYYMLHSTLSEAGVGQDGHPSDLSTSLDLQSYDHILSVVLADLGKLELLVRDVSKPRSFWELDQEVQVKSGAGALSIDLDMVDDLTKVFLEPSITLKVTDVALTYKFLAKLYTALFKTPTVEEKWSNRSEISVRWPLSLTFAEPWRRPLRHQWRPGGLVGI